MKRRTTRLASDVSKLEMAGELEKKDSTVEKVELFLNVMKK